MLFVCFRAFSGRFLRIYIFVNVCFARACKAVGHNTSFLFVSVHFQGVSANTYFRIRVFRACKTVGYNASFLFVFVQFYFFLQICISVNVCFVFVKLSATTHELQGNTFSLRLGYLRPGYFIFRAQMMGGDLSF